MRWVRFSGSLLACVLAVAGCGDGGGGDMPPDVDVCEEPFEFEEGDADGHAEPLAVPAGEARAGRLGPSELPPDPDDLSTVESGDFVLANEHIAILIEEAGPSDLFDATGGKPVGMGKVEGGAIVEPVDFNEMILSLGVFALATDNVTVLNDGSDGEPARIRAVGTLGPIESIGQLSDIASVFSNPGFEGLTAAMDYELAPGDRYASVTMQVANTLEAESTPANSLHLFFQVSRMPLYAEGPGFALGTHPDNTNPYIAFVNKGESGYAWEVPPSATEPDSSFFISLSGASVFRFPEFSMEGCKLHAETLGRLHVGGPGLDAVREVVTDARGEEQREITGTVTEADGSTPAEGVTVHATYEVEEDGETITRYVTRATTGSDGTYSLHVPADLTVDLETWRRGDVPAGPKTSAPGDSEVNFTLAGTGTIEVSVTDGMDGPPLPARIQIISEPEAADVPDYVSPSPLFGEAEDVGGRLHTAFPTDGQASFRVPAGDTHKVVVSRGFEYTMYDNDVTVSADVTVSQPVPLERVVNPPGYMCADFHIHTFRSPDAGDSRRFKIASAIADGVEIPVLSDHRWVGDFEETIQAMEDDGLSVAQWAYGISSIELSTFEWGHMGVFPLAPQPDGLNGGYVPWEGRLAPAVFDDARSRESGVPGVSPSIIINHGRAFGGQAFGEYFTAVDYDPATGLVGNPDLWDEQFRLVEVFNDASFNDMLDDSGNVDSTLRDWFSFLNHFPGRNYFAVGSSDSHDILAKNSPVGYPRTCLNVGVDTAEDLRTMGDAGLVRDVALAGDMTVSGGIHVTATADGGTVPMGGTVESAGASETVDVRVQAPCWIDVDTLEVWVNGNTPDALDPNQVIDLTADHAAACTTGNVFDMIMAIDVAIPTTGRSWVVFHAFGNDSLNPGMPGGGRDPFGVTNPIFFMP